MLTIYFKSQLGYLNFNDSETSAKKKTDKLFNI